MMAHGAMRPMKEYLVENANRYHDMGAEERLVKLVTRRRVVTMTQLLVVL